MLFMNATPSSSFQTDLVVTHVLAALFARLQAWREPVRAVQCRCVVPRLVDNLGEGVLDKALDEFLDSHPAVAYPHENVNSQCAGLFRCALDASLAAERQAKQVLELAMSRARNRSTIQPKEDPNHGKS